MKSSGQLKSSRMVYSTVVAVILALLSEHVNGGKTGGEPTWDYEGKVLGPALWHTQFEDCGMKMQSPIDLSTSSMVFTPFLQNFNLSQYRTAPLTTTRTLENAGGHTVKLSYSGPEITIDGGSLPGPYVLEQFHFHWGAYDFAGSEHIPPDGNAAPMEIHLVHRSKGYSMSEAAQKPFGLAVLGFFFQVSKRDNKDLAPLLCLFKDVVFNGETTEVPAGAGKRRRGARGVDKDCDRLKKGFSLSHLLPSKAESGVYYRYHGSLTTPPCYQSVIWTVFRKRINISSQQLEAFRSLQKGTQADGTGHPIVNNFRPTQDLNGRVVLTNDRRYRRWRQ